MWGAMLCNSAMAGERLVLAPGARIDDGRLDLVTMGALTRREALLEVIPGLRDGSYCDHPKVRRQTLAQVSIDTARPTAVLIDGEIAGVTPLRVRVLPEPLRFAVAG